MAIAIHKNCLFQPSDHRGDPQGRFVFLKGTIMGQTYTFATLCAPNSQQLTFIDQVLTNLGDFQEGRLILGGDFNVSPDPSLDTSANRSTHSHAFLRHFRKTLQGHTLVDCWRALHASEKDFSYYSSVHKMNTRIDLLLVDQGSLDMLLDATIDQITISDHAPVTLTLSLSQAMAKTRSWKLMENLLDDLRVVTGVQETLSHYFAENANGEVSDGILWEGHKAIVRGTLIALGSKIKKESQADFQRVLQVLQRAELSHKQTPDPEEFRRLTELRMLFSKLLDRRICRK